MLTNKGESLLTLIRGRETKIEQEKAAKKAEDTRRSVRGCIDDIAIELAKVESLDDVIRIRWCTPELFNSIDEEWEWLRAFCEELGLDQRALLQAGEIKECPTKNARDPKGLALVITVDRLKKLLESASGEDRGE